MIAVDDKGQRSTMTIGGKDGSVSEAEKGGGGVRIS